MLYGLDDLVTEVAYACSLRKSEAKRFYHAPSSSSSTSCGRVRAPAAPAWDGGRLLENSQRQKGPA